MTLMSRRVRTEGSFVLVSEPEDIHLLLFLELCIYVHYLLFKRKVLSKLSRLEEVVISTCYVLVGPGYLQHGRCG